MTSQSRHRRSGSLHAVIAAAAGILTGCATEQARLAAQIPDGALFTVLLSDFAERRADYRQVAQDGMITERMGYSPATGDGFAQFTYVLGPPGALPSSPEDAERAPQALESAVRGDPLLSRYPMAFDDGGIAENHYGTVHWRRFTLPGHVCVALGQALDDRAGLHGYYCLPGSDPVSTDRIHEAAQAIVRRPPASVGSG